MIGLSHPFRGQGVSVEWRIMGNHLNLYNLETLRPHILRAQPIWFAMDCLRQKRKKHSLPRKMRDQNDPPGSPPPHPILHITCQKSLPMRLCPEQSDTCVAESIIIVRVCKLKTFGYLCFDEHYSQRNHTLLYWQIPESQNIPADMVLWVLQNGVFYF